MWLFGFWYGMCCRMLYVISVLSCDDRIVDEYLVWCKNLLNCVMFEKVLCSISSVYFLLMIDMVVVME